MREDDMLRLSLDCARLEVHGEDYAPILAAGVHRILTVDAGTGVTFLTIERTGPHAAQVITAWPMTVSEATPDAMRERYA